MLIFVVITPISNCGKKYIFTLIDDFSRKLWVHFVVNKSEAFEVFRKFIIMIEKKSKEVFVCLRTDRGRDFMSNEFKAFCEEKGIRR